MNNEQQFLRGVLLANGLFSGLSGLVLLLLPGRIGALLGYPFPMLYGGLGLGLLAYAGQLFYQFRKRSPSRAWVIWFIVADIVWVAGSGIVLVIGTYITTLAGQGLVVGVAVIVGLFAGLQYRALPSNRNAQQ